MKTPNDLWAVVQRDGNGTVFNVVPIDHDNKDNCLMVLPTQKEAESVAKYQSNSYDLEAFAMPLVEFLKVWKPNR